jgi:hypothetical protein
MPKTPITVSTALHLIALSLASPVNTAWAEEAAQTVDVVALTKPDWKPYSAMYQGILAFEKYHVLAPDAPLLFKLRSDKKDEVAAPLSLRLVNDEKSIALAIANDLSFSLPKDEEMLATKAELVLNRKEKIYSWRTHIRTASVPTNRLRLGDFRLECRVDFVIAIDGASFLQKALLATLGRENICDSERGFIHYKSPFQLAAVRLSDAERSELLPTKDLKDNGYTFRLPLYDKRWSNDTLIELEPANATPGTNIPDKAAN